MALPRVPLPGRTITTHVLMEARPIDAPELRVHYLINHGNTRSASASYMHSLTADLPPTPLDSCSRSRAAESLACSRSASLGRQARRTACCSTASAPARLLGRGVAGAGAVPPRRHAGGAAAQEVDAFARRRPLFSSLSPSLCTETSQARAEPWRPRPSAACRPGRRARRRL